MIPCWKFPIDCSLYWIPTILCYSLAVQCISHHLGCRQRPCWNRQALVKARSKSQLFWQGEVTWLKLRAGTLWMLYIVNLYEWFECIFLPSVWHHSIDLGCQEGALWLCDAPARGRCWCWPGGGCKCTALLQASLSWLQYIFCLIWSLSCICLTLVSYAQNSMTALIVAVKGGYTEVVKELLKRNPNVNMTDKDGNTALMIAAKEGYTEIVQDLLDAGTYVNIPDRVRPTSIVNCVHVFRTWTCAVQSLLLFALGLQS